MESDDTIIVIHCLDGDLYPRKSMLEKCEYFQALFKMNSNSREVSCNDYSKKYIEYLIGYLMFGEKYSIPVKDIDNTKLVFDMFNINAFKEAENIKPYTINKKPLYTEIKFEQEFLKKVMDIGKFAPRESNKTPFNINEYEIRDNTMHIKGSHTYRNHIIRRIDKLSRGQT